MLSANVWMVRDEMKVNRDQLAPCGLYCGVCGIYYADKHHDERLKAKLGEFYGFKPEMLKCDGCQ